MTEREHNYFMQGVTMGTIHAILDRIGHKTPEELQRFIGAYLKVFKAYYEVKHQLPREDLGKNAFAAGREAMLAWRKWNRKHGSQDPKRSHTEEVRPKRRRVEGNSRSPGRRLRRV